MAKHIDKDQLELEIIGEEQLRDEDLDSVQGGTATISKTSAFIICDPRMCCIAQPKKTTSGA